MKSTTPSFLAFANWKTVLPCGLATLFFTAYLFPSYQAELNALAGAEVVVLDLRLSYTHQEVLDLFQALGPAGRARYAFVEAVVAGIYPIVYGVFFLGWLAALLRRWAAPRAGWWALLALPLLVVGFDYAENWGLLQLLEDYPTCNPEQVAFCSGMTTLKWTAFGGMGLALLAAGIRWQRA